MDHLAEWIDATAAAISPLMRADRPIDEQPLQVRAAPMRCAEEASAIWHTGHSEEILIDARRLQLLTDVQPGRRDRHRSHRMNSRPAVFTLLVECLREHGHRARPTLPLATCATVLNIDSTE